MKKLKYFYLGNAITMDHTRENESIAMAEADNGEFTIEDDGMEKPFHPTINQRLDIIEQFITRIKSLLPNF